MKLNIISIVYAFLCLPRIQADETSMRYRESFYHLTVCCTHLTGPRARNSHCCLDQESDPWGICSAVCQVERLNLRAPLRNTTLEGVIPVQDNKYQVLNLTVRSAVRYINITVEMNWVARPTKKCVNRDLCEFSSCVKTDPDNATKCVADLVTLIQFQKNRLLDDVTQPEVTNSIAAAGARTVNFQAAVVSTSDATPVNVTSSTVSSTMTLSSTASSTISTSVPTSLPIVESTSTAHVLKNVKSTDWTSVHQQRFVNISTTTTTSLRDPTTEITTEEDTDQSSRDLRSAFYSVNFVVGSVCGLIGGTVLTAIIIFLCWVRSANKRSKQNSAMRREVVPKHKVQPMANPFYSMSVPDIIGMVSDSQQTLESVYAQIGPVDTLSTQDSDSSTDDVVSSSYNTLGCTSTKTTTTTTTSFHMYNRLNRFLHDSGDSIESSDERPSTGYDTIHREDQKINEGFLQDKDVDGYYHCVDTPEDVNGNGSNCYPSVTVSTCSEDSVMNPSIASSSHPVSSVMNPSIASSSHPVGSVVKQLANPVMSESSLPIASPAVKLATQLVDPKVAQPSKVSEEYSCVHIHRKCQQFSGKVPANRTSAGQHAPGYVNIPSKISTDAAADASSDAPVDKTRQSSLCRHQTGSVGSGGVVVRPVIHSTNVIPDSVSHSSINRLVNPGNETAGGYSCDDSGSHVALQNRVIYFVLEREDDYTEV